MAVEIGIKGAATKASHRGAQNDVAIGAIGWRELAASPFPDVADKLMDAADAHAVGEFMHADDAARSGVPQIGPFTIHRVAPGIAALQARGLREHDGPTAGLDPFGIGGKPFASPTRIGSRFIP